MQSLIETNKDANIQLLIDEHVLFVEIVRLAHLYTVDSIDIHTLGHIITDVIQLFDSRCVTALSQVILFVGNMISSWVVGATAGQLAFFKAFNK